MDPMDVTALSPEINAGPLHQRQKNAGATFYEDLGNLWTRSFGDPLAEYWVVRRGVGLWDVSSLAKWRFAGPDALAALGRLTTRNASSLSAGAIRYAMILNERGRLLDEGTICIVSAEEVYFFGNEERPPFAEHLARHTADLDVGVENVGRLIPNIAVQGPDSLRLLTRLADVDLGSLGYFRLIPEPVSIAGVPGLVTRTGFTGEVGYEFFLTGGSDGAERVWDAILDEGATPFGLDAVEMLRVEMGMVIADEDYVTGETDPFDLSMDAFIELEGHDFVGREAAISIAAAPPRRFKTLVLDGPVPSGGSVVTMDGVPTGTVTSAAASPRFGTLALAVLETVAAQDGTKVEIEGRAATVQRLPLDRQGRPRSDPRSPLRVD